MTATLNHQIDFPKKKKKTLAVTSSDCSSRHKFNDYSQESGIILLMVVVTWRGAAPLLSY